jgi:hypothetical protein
MNLRFGLIAMDPFHAAGPHFRGHRLTSQGTGAVHQASRIKRLVASSRSSAACADRIWIANRFA